MVRRLGSTLVFLAACWLAGSAGSSARAPEEKFSGYAEWRKSDALIVDGQRIRWSPAAKFSGDKQARDFASIPLGFEVSGKGVRQPDGTILATSLEAKANRPGIYSKEVKQAADETEKSWVSAGAAVEVDAEGHRRSLGKLQTTGPDVARVRRIVDRLVPPYLEGSNFRPYVLENKDWNASARPNGMIVVHTSLLHAFSDDDVGIVLGHELVHVTHDHIRKEFKNAMILQIAALATAAAVDATSSKKTAAIVGLASTFSVLAMRNGYGRAQEDQADRVGLRYAAEGGFDVRRAPALWRRFAEQYGNSNVVVNFFFQDHSRSLIRAQKLEQEIALNYPSGAR